jgi:hypothetical protein
MNDRIRELAKQADLIKWDILPSGARTPDHASVVKAQKFAELIVQECLELTFGKDRRQLLDKGDLNGANLVQKDIIRVIKHFGVEE